jgi:DNA-binding NarL/FixJ family response regulator
LVARIVPNWNCRCVLRLEYVMSNLRLLVADDHEIVRKGLCALLRAHPGWEVVAEATNGLEASQTAAHLKPDVAVLDIAMPCIDGFEAARQIAKDAPQTAILLVTMYELRDVVRMTLRAGALGCILKSDAVADLAAAVIAVSQKEQFFSRKVELLFLDKAPPETPPVGPADIQIRPLSDRQREIIQLVAEGKSTTEVADLLRLSPGTVVKHRSDIMRRLNCHSMAEVVTYAIRNKIVQVS